MSRRRDGFLLPTAAMMGLVILGLAGMYFFAMRQQDTRGRRFQGSLVARHMAAGVVRHVGHRIRDAADPARPLPANPDPLLDFRNLARALPSQYERLLKSYEPRRSGLLKRDHRPLLDRLFGEGTAGYLDELEASVPGAELFVTLELDTGRLPGAPEWDVDQVPKVLTVTCRAEVRYGRWTEEATRSESVVVYPLAPPLLGRFGSNRGYTWHEPGRSFPGRPFDDDRPDQPLLGTATEDATESLQERYASKGWAFPRRQTLAPGGGAHGQHHLLWKPVDGEIPVPAARVFAEQPETLEEHPVDPLHPELTQEAYLKGVVQARGAGGELEKEGFSMMSAGGGGGCPASSPWQTGSHRTTPEPLPPLVPGRPEPPPPPVRESPFGTTLDPSPTFAPGSWVRVRAVSGLVLDRDREDADERDQVAEVGQPLPRREALAYLLGEAPREHWEWDTLAEARRKGQPVEGPLPVYGSQVENRNVQVDLDGDGVPETPVESEWPYRDLGLDRAFYDPLRIFPAGDSYRRYASRDMDLPASFLLELAGLSVGQAQEHLQRLAWTPGGIDEVRTFREVPRVLRHRDPVHLRSEEAGDQPAGEQLHYLAEEGADATLDAPDPEAAERSFLEHLGEAGLYQATRWQPTVIVYGQDQLEDYFPDRDLRGHRVVVFPPREEGTIGEVSLGGSAYHSGALLADLIEVQGALPEQEEDRLLELASPNLILRAGVEHHGLLRGRIEPLRKNALDVAKVRGRVFEGSAPGFSDYTSSDELGRRLHRIRGDHEGCAPLLSVWDDARDPVGERKHMGYRVAWVGLR